VQSVECSNVAALMIERTQRAALESVSGAGLLWLIGADPFPTFMSDNENINCLSFNFLSLAGSNCPFCVHLLHLWRQFEPARLRKLNEKQFSTIVLIFRFLRVV
jgi:hypothetical protein